MTCGTFSSVLVLPASFRLLKRNYYPFFQALKFRGHARRRNGLIVTRFQSCLLPQRFPCVLCYMFGCTIGTARTYRMIAMDHLYMNLFLYVKILFIRRLHSRLTSLSEMEQIYHVMTRRQEIRTGRVQGVPVSAVRYYNVNK